MAKDSLYTAGIPVVGYVGERNNQVLFEGKTEDSHWGESENGRAVETTEFKIDRKYWELMGRPEMIFLSMGTEEAFEKWIGPSDPRQKVSKWLEPAEVI